MHTHLWCVGGFHSDSIEFLGTFSYGLVSVFSSGSTVVVLYNCLFVMKAGSRLIYFRSFFSVYEQEDAFVCSVGCKQLLFLSSTSVLVMWKRERITNLWNYNCSVGTPFPFHWEHENCKQVCTSFSETTCMAIGHHAFCTSSDERPLYFAAVLLTCCLFCYYIKFVIHRLWHKKLSLEAKE